MGTAAAGGSVILLVLLCAISLVSVVCWIMTLIKIFKQNVGLGILGIVCGLFAFIYGWVKTKEFDNKKVMIAWTVAFAGTIVLQILGAGAAFAAIMSQPHQ